MLKLEHSSRTKMINISLRDQGPWVSSNFIRALFLAISLHLGGMLLFHVAPIKISVATTRFAPVQVAVEGGQSLAQEAVAEMQPSAIRFDTLLVPPSRPLPSEELPRALLNHEIAYSYASTNEIIFKSGEEVLHVDPLPSVEEAKVRGAGVELRIGGPLAERKLLQPQQRSNGLRFSAVPVSKEMHLIFDVKVDDRSGKVALYENRFPLRREKIKKYADKIIHSLQFDPNEGGFITDGIIEITFYPPTQEIFG